MPILQKRLHKKQNKLFYQNIHTTSPNQQPDHHKFWAFILLLGMGVWAAFQIYKHSK